MGAAFLFASLGCPWVSAGEEGGRQLQSESWLCLPFLVALVPRSGFRHASSSQTEPGGAAAATGILARLISRHCSRALAHICVE